ncbi:hypothetical protein PRUPE_6G105200 [Prunus persica]|uniref:Uncharacterized protein n=1 Tax=Prunus persica TaxID=3760 RepID=A0A251NNB1_PRUPE|nr:hypothetical protein PRUPE_6G105200 [Prunus persica]
MTYKMKKIILINRVVGPPTPSPLSLRLCLLRLSATLSSATLSSATLCDSALILYISLPLSLSLYDQIHQPPPRTLQKQQNKIK